MIHPQHQLRHQRQPQTMTLEDFNHLEEEAEAPIRLEETHSRANLPPALLHLHLLRRILLLHQRLLNKTAP